MTTIDEAWWRAVRDHGDRVAVRQTGFGGTTTLTYAELAFRAAGLTEALHRAGDTMGSPVGLLLDHGADMVAGMLGVLSAGGIYVPLDPGYPPARLAQVVEQSRLSRLVATEAHLPLASRLADGSPANTDLLLWQPDCGSDRQPERRATGPDSPAYLLHTSGSTGRPKGVVQTHGAVLHQVRLHTEGLGLGPDDRLSVASSFAFDMAVTDTFSALLSGASAVTVDARGAGLGALADALRQNAVTVLHSTPTVFRHLCTALAWEPEERLDALRVVVLGGEPVVAQDLERCRRHASETGVLVNGYGATEVSFVVQNHLRYTPSDTMSGDGPETTADPAAVLPIGRPLPGMQVSLLDADGMERGEEGEIAVVSDHLASYWDEPAETALRFDTDPVGRRRYRTGDLARRLPDGNLVCLGRRDRQVKIRGNRVEPAEVEAVLRSLPGVANAAVLAVGDELGLRAFVVPLGEASLDPMRLRAAVADRLPEFMVPSTVQVLPDLPMTPTGKVDGSALLATPSEAAPADDAGGLRRNPTEERLTAIWSGLLGTLDVPRDRPVFELGAHSLMVAQAHHRLSRELGTRIPLTDLYAHPTIADLAAHLDREDVTSATTPAITDASSRMSRRAARRRA